MVKFAALLFGLMVLVCAPALDAAEKPVMRVALISDTHIKNDAASCRWIKKLYTFLRDREPVDMVINAGDIADIFSPDGYRHYRRIINETFPDPTRRPAEIFVYANHDRYDEQIRKMPHTEAFPKVRELLEIPHAPDDILIFKGHPFLVVNQFITMEKYEKMLSGLAAAHPGKPLFVIDHLPPIRRDAAGRKRIELLKKFPQVIHISGHTHGSLFDETRIWQDGYTALNLGCFGMVWEGILSAARPGWKPAYEFCIMEVFKNRIVFRRFSILDQKEYLPEAPWTVPLPYDDAAAPYRLERRRAASAAPEFPAGAALRVTTPRIPFRRALLYIPFVKGAHHFDLEIAEQGAGDRWKPLVHKQVFNNFHLLPENPRKRNVVSLYGAYFRCSEKYRITVTPVGFFGRAGRPLTVEWTAPARLRTEVVFESFDPMRDPRLSFRTGLSGGEAIRVVDGFYDQQTYHGRLVVPDEVWESNTGNDRYWVTVDIHTIQQPGRMWTIIWRNAVPRRSPHGRIRSFPGDFATRYGMEFKLPRGHRPYLLIHEGDAGRIKFNYLRIERILPLKNKSK